MNQSINQSKNDIFLLKHSLLQSTISPVGKEMAAEYLQQRGLTRLHRLLLNQRYDIAGILLGQLMNCAMYSEQIIFIQPTFVHSIYSISF